MKKLFSLLMAVMILFSLAIPAAAAENEGYITIYGNDNIRFKPGSSYSATDLFDDGFKNVMPGDKISETITITSGFLFREDSLKVYMRAIPHTSTDNKPVADEITDVDVMNDFLNQLTLRVYNESKNGQKIFEGKANELDGLKNNVLLGTFRRGSKIKLKVELEVPITMGNEYANQIGEVDWLFTVEAFDDPNYEIPKTGDYILGAVAVMAVSGAVLSMLLIRKKRKR